MSFLASQSQGPVEGTMVELLNEDGSARLHHANASAYYREIASALLTTVLAAHKNSWGIFDSEADSAKELLSHARTGVDALQAIHHSISSYLKTEEAHYLPGNQRPLLKEVLGAVQLEWQNQRNNPDKYRDYGSLGDGNFQGLARSLRTSLEEARVDMPLSICSSPASTNSLTAKGLPCLRLRQFTSTAEGAAGDHPLWKEACANGAAGLMTAVRATEMSSAY